MKTLHLALLLPLVAGCLSSTPVSAVRWTVDPVAELVEKQARKYEVVRVTQFSVRAPYDTSAMVLLREDGSLAFDAYNHFAASPLVLLKGPIMDVMRESGLFADVVWSSSAVRSNLSAEIDVSRMALVVKGGSLKAVVDLQLTLIDQRERTLKAFAQASVTVDATSGCYSKAFSSALTGALSKALGDL